MDLAHDRRSSIIRTERGLTISGTRITLYDVMDYLIDQYPTKFIQSLLGLTEEQMNVALSYIAVNHSELEAEYQLILKLAEESRQYWEGRNCKRLAHVARPSAQSDQEALRAKLQAQKAKHEQEA